MNEPWYKRSSGGRPFEMVMGPEVTIFKMIRKLGQRYNSSCRRLAIAPERRIAIDVSRSIPSIKIQFELEYGSFSGKFLRREFSKSFHFPFKNTTGC
jgi:hypothetical protein